MLTKKDLNQIEEITQRVVKKNISEAFLDFYNKIKEYIKDHDDCIENLETIVRVKN